MLVVQRVPEQASRQPVLVTWRVALQRQEPVPMALLPAVRQEPVPMTLRPVVRRQEPVLKVQRPVVRRVAVRLPLPLTLPSPQQKELPPVRYLQQPLAGPGQ